MATNILNKHLLTKPIRGGPPAWGLDKGLITPHRKTKTYYEMLHRASELVGYYEHGNEILGSV
jgi:predicted kinase